jgi:hypothetical protein
MKKVFLLAALALCLGGCFSSKSVTLQTYRPADITVSAAIQTILLVDRTKVNQSDWLAIGESILTGELPFEDRVAAQEALNALKNKLQQSPRFQIKIARERYPGNSLSGAFPTPLPWEEQKELLQRYQAQALLSIEIMDSDFLVTRGKRRVDQTVKRNGEDVTIKVDEFYAEGLANVKLGFRFYHPAQKEIIDQQLISENRTWRSAARSKTEAIAQLISKSRATKILATQAGEDYAFKLAPLPITLKRDFYFKAKQSEGLERGARLAEVDDWAGAIRVWKQALNKPQHPKDAARLAINVAVGYEVLGNFEKALYWAQQAYTQYNYKNARGYVQKLNARMADAQRLNQQLPVD